jgi:phenylalanine-4-hydroxylase
MTPWFPVRPKDMDAFAERVLECGEELNADHPGFTDAAYRARRAEITQIAKKFKT